MGPVRQNPIQRTVRTAHLSVLSVLMTVSIYKPHKKNKKSLCANCAKHHYIIQHRIVLTISSLTSRQPSYLRFCRLEEKGAQDSGMKKN